MPRRVPIRLVRLLAVACACLVPAAAAQAAPPPNDVPTARAGSGTLAWTSLSVLQDVVVQAADWGEATTGPEDADPLPSCTGSPGFRSMWYYAPGAGGRRPARDGRLDRPGALPAGRNDPRPVATTRSAAGSRTIGKPGATANATAYVTPSADGAARRRYLIRVAEVVEQLPLGRAARR